MTGEKELSVVEIGFAIRWLLTERLDHGLELGSVLKNLKKT